MSSFVGAEGVVVGVDYDEKMIAEAKDRAAKSQTAERLRHEVADAKSLPFASDCFDVCRSERMLQHVTDSDAVICELLRVVKPGGRVLVADTDWYTLSIDAPDVELERRISRGLAGLVCNGCAGRNLFRLLVSHGLRNVRALVYPLVWTEYSLFRATTLSIRRVHERLIESATASQDDLDRFFAALQGADRRGAFFATASVIIVVGIK